MPSNPDDLTPEARFALDPVGLAGHEPPVQPDQETREWGEATLQRMKREFIGDDPIRRWLLTHSAAFYAIVDVAAFTAMNDGRDRIDPEDVAERMEVLRNNQMASWGSFDTGRREGR